MKIFNKFPSSECISVSDVRSSLFFKSRINLADSFLLFSSIDLGFVCVAFPSKEILKSSLILIQTSLQTWPNKFILTVVIFVLVNLIRCTSRADSLKKISSFSQTSLYPVCVLLSVAFPKICILSGSLEEISRGKEASSGLYCEYRCQSFKILASKMMSYSVSEIVLKAVFHTTGFSSV